MNRYELTEEVRNTWKPIIKVFIEKLESLTEEDMKKENELTMCLELSGSTLNPYTLMKILKELGYTNESIDSNGWQMDFWIKMSKNNNIHYPSGCENLIINGCGITFELILSVEC